jgi:hypothetical protein
MKSSPLILAERDIAQFAPAPPPRRRRDRFDPLAAGCDWIDLAAHHRQRATGADGIELQASARSQDASRLREIKAGWTEWSFFIKYEKYPPPPPTQSAGHPLNGHPVGYLAPIIDRSALGLFEAAGQLAAAVHREYSPAPAPRRCRR